MSRDELDLGKGGRGGKGNLLHLMEAKAPKSVFV
jgi:hypothetical protein